MSDQSGAETAPGRAQPAPGHPGIARIAAPNPSPMTLTGTNTYLVADSDDGVWVVDPGPRIESHLEAIRGEAARRGGIRGVLLTHSHADHSEAAHSLGAPVVLGEAGEADEADAFAASSSEGERSPRDCDHPSTRNAGGSANRRRIGPIKVIPTPGHAADHVALLVGTACLCGDLILGEGSSIVPPRSHGGSLIAYLDSLERIAKLDPDLLAPGHGPWITEPKARIEAYIAHRFEREQKLVAALEAGERDRERLLDAAWDDVPDSMRPAAAIALQAHLEKLADEQRLPGPV